MSKEAISKIREALGEDSSKVESMLVEINSDYSEFQRKLDDQQETIKSVNTESKGRKLEIRELKSNLDDEKEKIEKLEGQDKSKEVTDLTEKLKVFTDADAEQIKTKAKGFIDKFDKLKVHADFDACKSKFKLPEAIKDDKDGKLDWDSMDDNDIAKNADGLTEYIGIGKFSEADPNSEDRSSGGGGAKKVEGVFTNEMFGK